MDFRGLIIRGGLKDGRPQLVETRKVSSMKINKLIARGSVN